MNRAFAVVMGLLLTTGCAASPSLNATPADNLNDTLRLNQIQAIGTHNSYKLAIDPPLMELIKQRSANTALTLDYSHRPIAEQLDAGARQVEIDPVDDPEGGAFVDPLGVRMLAQQGVTIPPPDRAALAKPGIKVIHATDIDFRTSCPTFVNCISQVKAWSDANRMHTPILIMINPKHSPISWEGATPVRPFGKDAFNRMEAEILSVFPRERIVTPDEVRGTHATLRAGVLAGGWPTLASSRGKVIFVIDDAPARWAAYVEGHPSLKGRVAFVGAGAAFEAAEAAILVMNDPHKDEALIRERVAQGFLIRTRADADTREARSGDTKRREAALASGAQFISTDYIWPDDRFGTGYTARLSGNAAAQCNPVNAPAECGQR